MAARFDDAIKQQQVRNEITANAVKRQQSAELRKMREEIYRTKKAYSDVLDENTVLKQEKEADAKTIALMVERLEVSKEFNDSLQQSNTVIRHLFHNCVEKLHHLIGRKRARFPYDSD
jgi:hypothetical protein